MAPVQFGLFVPQGWILDLVDIEDPIEQYETMSRIALTAERLGFDSIWLFDHFHTYFKPYRDDLRVLDLHGGTGSRYQSHPAGPDGHLQRLSQSGPHGEDGIHRGRSQPRPARLRHRGGLVRARIPGLRI